MNMSELLGAPEPWTRDALCATTDPDLFFPEEGHHGAGARRVCGACPVADMCLAYALRNNETEGIWGGLSPAERHKLRRAA